MAAAPAEVGRGTLYVFVKTERVDEPACFSNLCSPEDTVRSLHEAIERQSRDAGVLQPKQCIRHLKLVFQNHPEVLLSSNDLLDIVFTILEEHSGKNWRQTLASGVWPRITAVVKKKKKRTQAATAFEEKHEDAGLLTPAREEAKTSRKRQAEGSANQEGNGHKSKKHGAGGTARSQDPPVSSAAADQARPSGAALRPSSDEVPTDSVRNNRGKEKRRASSVQQKENARGSEERGATLGKEAQRTGVGQRGEQARGAWRATSTEEMQEQWGSGESDATMWSDEQDGGADRREAQVLGDEGRPASGRDKPGRGVDEWGGPGRGQASGARRDEVSGAKTRGQREVERGWAEERELIGCKGGPAKGADETESALRREKPGVSGTRQTGAPSTGVDGGPKGSTVQDRKRLRRVRTNYPISDSEDEAGPSLTKRPVAVEVETAPGEAGGPRALGSSSGGICGAASGGSERLAAAGEPLEEKRSSGNLPGMGGKGVGLRSNQSAGGPCAGRGSEGPADARHAVRCDACEDTDNLDLVLVCARDGCRTARHIFCHSEELEEVPEGDWFCCAGCEKKGEARTGGPWEVVGRPICSEPGCSKNAYYGYKEAGQIVREWCGKHKQSDMQQTRGNVCEVLGCNTHAHYANQGAVRGRRCAKHREEGMQVMFTYLCDVSGCPITASWRSTESKARRCTAHKLPGMTPRWCCKTDGCSRQPTFHFSGEPRSACLRHARPGMMSCKTKRILLPRDCL